jgi:hypothetical protein
MDFDSYRGIQDAVQEQMVEVRTDSVSKLDLMETRCLLCLNQVFFLQVLIFL